jgi:ferric enterobactin receptor
MKNRYIMKIALLCGIAILCLRFTPVAQDTLPAFKLTGKAADSATGKPVEFLTITAIDSTGNPVKAAITKADGGFSIAGLGAGNYTIVFQGLAYRTREIPVQISAAGAEQATDIGVIMVIQKVNRGDEATVVAVKPLIKQELGRISYNLSADPESKVSSVLDMMHKIPYISVDGNGTILLKGNSNFRILINGKPSSMLERNLNEVLRSIPASTVVRIEVITTPPPKYEAEGLAGIINIVTTRRAVNGYNGSVNLYHRFPVGGPGIGTAFAFKKGKFALSGYAGGSIYNTPSFDNTFGRKTSGTDPVNLEQAGNRRSDSRSGYIGTELSWELDSLNLLSGQVNFNGSNSQTGINQQSALTGAAGLLEKYNLYNAIDYGGSGMDAGINLQHKFKNNQARLLTFSYNFFKYSNKSNNDLNVYNAFNFTQPDFRQKNDESFNENTLQVDYVHSLKSLNIEMGAKAIWRGNSSDYNYLSFDSVSGNYIKEPAFSNVYKYQQNVYAFYNSYQYMKEKWGLVGGIRVEQTYTSVNFLSSSTSVEQNYFNVIPSVAFNYNIKKSNFSIGFVQRIRRPSITRLNPFTDRSNPNVAVSGNPDLRQVILNDIQLGYGYSNKISVNVGFGYSFFNKLDLRVYAFDPSTNITSITFANVGKGNRIGLDLNINYPVSPRLNVSLNGNLAHFTITGGVGSVLLTNKWLTWFASPSIGFNFNKGWRANANLSVNSRNPSSFQGTTNAFVTSAFSVNKEYFKGKLVFSAAVNNPFTKFRGNILQVSGPGFEEQGRVNEYFRLYSVSVNFKFGQLQDGVKKTRRNINNDDISTRKE